MKMYSLYLKGLSTDNQELSEIRDIFNDNGLSFTNVFDSYSNLAALSKNAIQAEINEKIRRANPTMQDINLICHSMGCNLGVLAAEQSKKIKSLVLISPELGEYSTKEKRKIEEANIHLTFQRQYGEKETRLSSNKIRSIIVFNRTKPWATLTIEKVDIPVLIIYSKDDTFIPKEYLENLAKRKDNVKIETINSKLHNPLTSQDYKNKTIKLIKNFQK